MPNHILLLLHILLGFTFKIWIHWERIVECKSPKNNEMHKHWELKPYGYRVYVYAYQYWLGTVRFLLMWPADLCPLFSLCSIIIWLVLIIHLCSVMLLSFFFFVGSWVIIYFLILLIFLLVSWVINHTKKDD